MRYEAQQYTERKNISLKVYRFKMKAENTADKDACYVSKVW